MKARANNMALWWSESRYILESLLDIGLSILKISKLSILVIKDVLTIRKVNSYHYRDKERIIEYEMRKEML